jgi:hypothetical protein
VILNWQSTTLPFILEQKQHSVNIISFTSARGQFIEMIQQTLFTQCLSSVSSILAAEPFSVGSSLSVLMTAEVCVSSGDTVDVTRELQLQNLNPAMLNMASSTSPGGGYVQLTLCLPSSSSYHPVKWPLGSGRVHMQKEQLLVGTGSKIQSKS